MCIEKTDKLADKHYQRVSNFAKEMLVNPTELNVHKLQNVFSEEIRDNPVRHKVGSSVKPIPGVTGTKHPQPPMKFNTSTSSPERIAN